MVLCQFRSQLAPFLLAASGSRRRQPKAATPHFPPADPEGRPNLIRIAFPLEESIVWQGEVQEVQSYQLENLHLYYVHIASYSGCSSGGHSSGLTKKRSPNRGRANWKCPSPANRPLVRQIGRIGFIKYSCPSSVRESWGHTVKISIFRYQRPAQKDFCKIKVEQRPACLFLRRPYCPRAPALFLARKRHSAVPLQYRQAELYDSYHFTSKRLP